MQSQRKTYHHIASVREEAEAIVRHRQLRDAGFDTEFVHAYGGRPFPINVAGNPERSRQFLDEIETAEKEVIGRYSSPKGNNV